MPGTVAAVHAAPQHGFSKPTHPRIRLLAGLGVAGDAHCGATVKHRSRVAKDPNQPNLRQVHLLHEELLAELRGKGFPVEPGDMGENITTRGVDLLALPRGTRLRFAGGAEVELTGLRNPCAQIEAYQAGLLKAVLDRTDDGSLVRKAGVMGIVLSPGAIGPGDAIAIAVPPVPHEPLRPV